jgi:hypothetical protein
MGLFALPLLLAHERLMTPRRLAHSIPIRRKFGILRPHLAGGQFLNFWGMNPHPFLDFAHCLKTIMQILQTCLLLCLLGLPCPFRARHGQQTGRIGLSVL